MALGYQSGAEPGEFLPPMDFGPVDCDVNGVYFLIHTAQRKKV